ncbi:FAD:protein FMN transferase [Actinomyces sp.]|uniref:FAD:protein FMN transferase n=1 Tax=Actinomyces sp. TaxID=29317 RepID=UPI0026DAD24D|nr:FAD:protein FMN transferase [Actinomyces sp.]MDO4899117.1 FAD:protein FMN transferase [Actinomyces sp.]
MCALEAPGGLTQAWHFEATGCRWVVYTRSPLPDTLREKVTARVDAFEDVWSRFRTGSLMRRAAAVRVSHGPGGGRIVRGRHGEVVLELPPGSAALLDLYDRLHGATDGRIDPLAGADLVALGYDAEYSFVVRDGAVHRLGADHGRPTWADTARHDGDRLVLHEPVLIDVGAAGKGFLADLLAAWLREDGRDEYLIDADGDLLVHCSEPVRIGLERPGAASGGEGEVVGVVELANGAVCASGVSRRTWGPGLHHILDAHTGLPIQGMNAVIATWAVAGSCAEADGLATALFVSDPAALAAAGFDYDFALLRADGSAAVSRTWHDLPAELFTSSSPRRDR